MSTLQAWTAFQVKGAVPSNVSEELLQSWRRSRWSGVDPEHAELNMRDVPLESPFTRAAVPVMLDAAQSLRGSDTCLVLADANGTIVWRWVSDSSLGRTLDGGHLHERAHFGEEAVGTNGVGTAIETKRVATVVGPSHYARSFHDWACVAAPVIHPVTRRVCGVVNITCRAQDANGFLALAIKAMNASIREELYSHTSRNQRMLLEAYLGRRSKTLSTLVAVNGSIVISDELTWDHDTLWQEVMTASPASKHLVTSAGVTARVWPVRPGSFVDGVVLEIVPDSSSSPLPGAVPDATAQVDVTLSALEEAERDVIRRSLVRNGGNKTRTAEELQISRRSLYNKLRRYRIRP